MNFRDPSLLVGGAVGAAIVFMPGRGFMGPAMWFGTPRLGLMIPMGR